MRRASSIRNYTTRRSKWSLQARLGVVVAVILLVVGFTALMRSPNTPSSAADRYSDLSRAKNSQAEVRELSQVAQDSRNASVDASLTEKSIEKARKLVKSVSGAQGAQLRNATKLESTDLVNRLDRSTARNQLRTKAKAITTLGVGTETPLVLYNLLESEDPENIANLQYYVREGIREDDGCTHIILVDSKKDLRALPALQIENARYVRRKAKDCQLGAMGSFLKSKELDLTKFTSFIFLSSAVRGPFLPTYIKNTGIRWQQFLTSKLNNHTKLVGPVISCQDIVWPNSVPEKERRHGQPHFSKNMVATDKTGLDLLLAHGDIFTCHDREVPNSEDYSMMLASTAILQNGFNLDCLMHRYQGIAWSGKETWGCNAGLKAEEGDFYYDSISIHPMEVMFVEVTSMMLQKGLSMSKAAKKYDRWRQNQAELKEDVAFNMYAFDPKIFRAPKIAYMEKRGPGCFDFNYYAEKNAEVGIPKTDMLELWNHFVDSGQFENRQYRFNCLDILARSFNCFDSEYYNRANEDLNQLRLEGRALSPQEAWNHFLEMGYFESRKYRFRDVCSDDLDSPNNLGEGT